MHSLFKASPSEVYIGVTAFDATRNGRETRRRRLRDSWSLMLMSQWFSAKSYRIVKPQGLATPLALGIVARHLRNLAGRIASRLICDNSITRKEAAVSSLLEISHLAVCSCEIEVSSQMPSLCASSSSMTELPGGGKFEKSSTAMPTTAIAYILWSVYEHVGSFRMIKCSERTVKGKAKTWHQSLSSKSLEAQMVFRRME